MGAEPFTGYARRAGHRLGAAARRSITPAPTSGTSTFGRRFRHVRLVSRSEGYRYQKQAASGRSFTLACRIVEYLRDSIAGSPRLIPGTSFPNRTSVGAACPWAVSGATSHRVVTRGCIS